MNYEQAILQRMLKVPAWLVLTAVLGALLTSAPLFAKDGNSIMQEVYEQGRKHKNQTSRVDMFIQDSKGKKKERSFTNKTKIFKKETNSVIRIFQPTRLKNTAILTITEDDGSGDSSQWSYLPAFKAVRALNAHSKSQSFMGSDLTNDDVGGRHPSRDEHTLEDEDKGFYYITSIPKDSKDLYTKLELKVHKQTLIPTEIDFYGKQGLIKNLQVVKIGKSNGMFYSKESLVINDKTSGQTTLTVTGFDTKSKIRNGEVNLKGLKQ